MTEMMEFFRETGKAGGKKAAENMTAEQRKARAKKAVAAREAKRQSKREAEAATKKGGK